jgi:hypothetical protein
MNIQIHEQLLSNNTVPVYNAQSDIVTKYNTVCTSSMRTKHKMK